MKRVKAGNPKLSDFGGTMGSVVRAVDGDGGVRGSLAPTIRGKCGNARRRILFRKALTTLSSNERVDALTDDDKDDFIEFFDGLYSSDDGGFRHMYSDVCTVMYRSLEREPFNLDTGVPPEVAQLSENIRLITLRVPKDKNVLAENLMKLFDHIELERQRMRYFAAQNKAHSQEITDLQKNLTDDFKSKVAEARDSSERSLAETSQKIQKNYVTILGIFAAVVMAFMSAMSLTGSVLEAMGSVSIYRLSFTMLVLGFFVFNLVYVLMDCIFKIIGVDPPKRTVVVVVDVVVIALIIFVCAARFGNMLD